MKLKSYLILQKVFILIKSNQYFLISLSIHFGIILAIVLPLLFSQENNNFITAKQIPIKIIIQEPSHSKSIPKKKEGILKNKEKAPQKKESIAKNQLQEETIIDSQYAANINYKILKSSEPRYPSKVKRLNLKQQVVIKTRLLVDKTGGIISIEFIASNIEESLAKYFQKEILDSLNSWRFSPITVNDVPVKIYFYKDFVFVNL